MEGTDEEETFVSDNDNSKNLINGFKKSLLEDSEEFLGIKRVPEEVEIFFETKIIIVIFLIMKHHQESLDYQEIISQGKPI